MNYIDLKDGKKVMVYIPLLDSFRNAEIIEWVSGNGFTIAFTKPICGHHNIMKYIKNQDELEKWFFVTNRQPVTDELKEKGIEKFNQNGKDWIFTGQAFRPEKTVIKRESNGTYSTSIKKAIS